MTEKALALLRRIEAGTVTVEDLDRAGKITATKAATKGLITAVGDVLTLTDAGQEALEVGVVATAPKRRGRPPTRTVGGATAPTNPDLFAEVRRKIEEQYRADLAALDRVEAMTRAERSER